MSGNPTFSQIHQQYRPSGLTASFQASEHLRGDPMGTRLYTHEWYAISNSGAQALSDRQAKWAQGADIVRQSIDTEYGPGVGAQVFQKILAEGGRDLRPELYRGDLPQIRTTINEVRPGSIPELDGPKTPFKAQLDANQTAQVQVFGVDANDPTQRPGRVTRTAQTDQTLTAMFGRRLTDADIKGLGGLPERCDVQLDLVGLDPRLHRNIDPNTPGVMISKSGADPSGAFREIQMTAYRDKTGKVNIYRDSTKSHLGQTIGDPPMPRPNNLGACALGKQVDTARALGVNTIHNFASQGKGYNGYYTWARCGGNASLAPDNIRIVGDDDFPTPGKTNLREQDEGGYQKFRKALAGSDNVTIQQLAVKPDLDVQDFMQTADGRSFWRDNGFAIPLEFNLQDGSKTMQTINQYTLPNSCFRWR